MRFSSTSSHNFFISGGGCRASSPPRRGSITITPNSLDAFLSDLSDKECNIKIFEKKLKVLPPPLDTPEKIFEDGWYDLEINPDAFLGQWRWTAKEARCIIDNPKRDALLVIKGGVNLDALEDQKVIIKINDRILDEFIPDESYFEKSYNIKKEMVGEGEQFFLIIATDKVFIPADIIPNSKDERELGLQISFVYFR